MISSGKIVTITYNLKNDKGKELDSADALDPLVYLHGAGQIIPGLEHKLESHKSGDKVSVVIDPEDAYGEVNPDLRLSIDKDTLPEEMSPAVGIQFEAEVGTGDRLIFTIVKVEDDRILVDGNHPLAGETLHFEVEVMEIRDATKEEIEHGHPHEGNGDVVQ